MDTPEPSIPQLVAGVALLVALFLVREVASGALREAGKELWKSAKRRKGRLADVRCRRTGVIAESAKQENACETKDD